MSRALVVPGGVVVLGAVTASNVSTGHAQPEVNPGIAGGQALFTSLRGVRAGRLQLVQMRAGRLCHGSSPRDRRRRRSIMRRSFLRAQTTEVPKLRWPPPYTPPSAALHPSLAPPPPASPGTPPPPRTASAGESLPRPLAAYAEEDPVPAPPPVVAALPPQPAGRPQRLHRPRLHQVVDGRHLGADEVLL